MVKVFDYLKELDCFIVNPTYKQLADRLGLSEWNEVVWIGRYFLMDNDFGEHWFDNWEARDAVESQATAMGLDVGELFILDPDRFKNDKDGPCHSPNERVLFWKDVLLSLHISYETLFREARKMNNEIEHLIPEDYILDLEDRISQIAASHAI